MHLLQSLLNSSRRSKQIIVVCFDFCLLFFTCWLALALRLGEFVDPLVEYWQACLLAPLVSIPILIYMGMYRTVVRHLGNQAVWTGIKAVSLSVLVWATIMVMLQISAPRSVLLLYWFTAVPLLVASRFFARWVVRQIMPGGDNHRANRAENVVLYGAGIAGAQLASALATSPEFKAIAFIDDNPTKQGTEVCGLRVHPFESLPDLITNHEVTTVLLAMSGIGRARRRILIDKLDEFEITTKILPGVSELASGAVQISDIREIDVVDLLGRDQVAPFPDLLKLCIENCSVLVTGAGGSIGAELCRQIILQRPNRLVLFEVSEFNLYQIEGELRSRLVKLGYRLELIAILGNVQDYQHLLAVMRNFKVDTLYHAAAYKHVPLVEENALSGVKNNVLGTLYAAEAAAETGVSDFVLISTDKAVRPTNVMGASKRFAELVLQALSHREGTNRDDKETTKFSMVRFGNVLDSSGSVIPLFRKQINDGGPITVTHPEITRYFMTIPEAANLVIQAGSLARSGDVFVLDMGTPVRINDLANEMIKLAGLSVRDDDHPDGDIEINFTGLRPAEKLYEELLIGGEVSETGHPKIMRSTEHSLSWEQMTTLLERLDTLDINCTSVQLRDLLCEAVGEYTPKNEVVDYLGRDRATTIDTLSSDPIVH